MAQAPHWPFSLLDRLEAPESRTFKRLAKSQHVADLRIIVFVAGLIVCTFWALAAIGLVGVCVLYFVDQPILKNVLIFKDFNIKESVVDFLRFCGATGTIGAIVVAWAYQTGSRRLGVVDLFACEITTLCRVGTVVEFIPNMLAQYNSVGAIPKKPTPSKLAVQELRFNSQENYFPVFENNAKDLQILEADVVNNVTAFYTYMKATRDMLRQLSDFQLNAAPPEIERNAVVNVIYMVFLAYESARHAIDDVVEFEPTQAENKIVLLFTELPAYRFLRKRFAEGEFKDEIRMKRIDLRLTEYQKFIPELCAKVRANAHQRAWDKANSLVTGLGNEFDLLEQEAAKPLSTPTAANAVAATAA